MKAVGRGAAHDLPRPLTPSLGKNARCAVALQPALGKGRRAFRPNRRHLHHLLTRPRQEREPGQVRNGLEVRIGGLRRPSPRAREERLDRCCHGDCDNSRNPTGRSRERRDQAKATPRSHHGAVAGSTGADTSGARVTIATPPTIASASAQRALPITPLICAANGVRLP